MKLVKILLAGTLVCGVVVNLPANVSASKKSGCNPDKQRRARVLTQADVPPGSDFSGADLSCGDYRSIVFQDVNLRSANLNGAQLGALKNVVADSATLVGARIWELGTQVPGTDFYSTGISGSFKQADFSFANVAIARTRFRTSQEFVNARNSLCPSASVLPHTLKPCLLSNGIYDSGHRESIFDGAIFVDASVSYFKPFAGVGIPHMFRGANFTRARLRFGNPFSVSEEADDFTRAKMGIISAGFEHALVNKIFIRADFGGAKLDKVDFRGSNLSNSNFAGANLQNAKFYDAITAGANFKGAKGKYYGVNK